MYGVTEVERILVRIMADASQYDRVIDQTVGRMSQAAAKLTAAGRRMTMGISAPLLALATISVFAAGRFEYSAAKIQGAANMSSSEIRVMTESIRGLSRDLGMRPTALIDTFEELTKGGMDLKKIMEGAGRTSAQLAKVGELPTGMSATTLVKIMNIFRKENLDAAQSANILSAAADASVISIGDMVHSVSQGASMASLAGQTFGDFATSIVMLGQAGMVSRDAGTSMKTFFMALASAEREKYFKKFGMQVSDAQNRVLPFRQLVENLQKTLGRLSQMDQLRAVGQMFGTDAARAGIILGVINKGAAGFDAMKKKMEGALTVEQKFALLQNTFNGQMERAIGLLEDAGIGIGTQLIPYLRLANDQLQKAISWWGGLSDVEKSAIFHIAGYAAAIGPAMILTGRLVGIITRLGSSFLRLGGLPVKAILGMMAGLRRLTIMSAIGLPIGIRFGRAFILGGARGIVSMSSYLTRVVSGLWRVVAIAAAPLVSLFAPLTMDVVKLMAMASRSIVRLFAFIPGIVVPVFAALWSALFSFVTAIPTIFVAVGQAMRVFIATIPAVFTAFQTAAGVLLPWAARLGQAMVSLFAATLAPVWGMIASTTAALFAAITAQIGMVVAGLASFIALPVIIIGGIILVVEGIRMLIGALAGLDDGFKINAQSAANMFKTVVGFMANFGENWDKFVGWFRDNWGYMLQDMLSLTLTFFTNMLKNTGVALAGVAGYIGILLWESIKWAGEGLVHLGKLLIAWSADQITRMRNWGEQMKAIIKDAFNPMKTGKSYYEQAIEKQKAVPTMMSQVGEFKPAAFGDSFNKHTDSLISWMEKNTSSPFEGFQSSMKPLPQFNLESKFAEDLVKNGLFGMLPKAPIDALGLADKNPMELPPDIKALLDQFRNQQMPGIHIPDFGKPQMEKQKSPGDTFGQTSFRRFALEGPGGLARPTGEQQISAPGVETKLEEIRQLLAMQKAVGR